MLSERPGILPLVKNVQLALNEGVKLADLERYEEMVLG